MLHACLLGLCPHLTGEGVSLDPFKGPWSVASGWSMPPALSPAHPAELEAQSQLPWPQLPIWAVGGRVLVGPGCPGLLGEWAQEGGLHVGAGRAPALQGQLWHSVQNDPKSVSEPLSPLSLGMGGIHPSLLLP